jgi:hypothetical protein
VEIFFIFRPRYKSINYLALIVKGVWTSVTLPSVFLNKLKNTFSIVWGRSWPSSIFIFFVFFDLCLRIFLVDQWSEGDLFICLEFIWGLFFFVIMLRTYYFWFFIASWFSTSTIITYLLKVLQKEFRNPFEFWDFFFFQFIIYV